MRAAIVYYSKTGRTRQVALYVEKKLAELGLQTNTYEIRQVREYSKRFLHLNPRVIYDTLTGRLVEIRGLAGFNPEAFDVLLLGTPIWFETVAPAMRSFIKQYKGKVTRPIACFTTANLRKDYALKFKVMLESLGYRVIAYVSISDFTKDRSTVDDFISKVVEYLRTSR